MIPKRKKNKKLYGYRIPVSDRPEKIIVSKKEKYIKRELERLIDDEINDKER